MLERIRRCRQDERGAVLVIVAILMVVFMGLAALAIDVGSFYQAQRQAQSAADAGALAASQDLPNNPTGAMTDASAYALKNYPSATVPPPSIYNNNKYIKVTVNAVTPTFFGQIFGITHADVSASAVAGGYGRSEQAAIFAYADGGNCGDQGIVIDHNNINISGGIQSNGSLTVTGLGTSHIDSGAYGTGCSFNGNGSAFSPYPPYASPPTTYPIDYRNNPPICTSYETGTYTFSGAVPPGVYCNTTGTFDLVGASGTGVTFVANQIAVSGQNSTNLTGPGSPGHYGLLLYQTGCDASAGALVIGGNGPVLNGTIFAPCATVNITQNNGATGFIEANNVEISFNNFTVTGDGPVIAGTGDALVQ